MHSSKCFHLCSSIKHLGNSHCTEFAIFEGIMYHQTYSPVADVYPFSNSRNTNPWSSWTTTLTWSRPFTTAKVVWWQAWSSSTTLVLPFIKLFSSLCRYASVNLRWFDPLWLQKPDYSTLFINGAAAKWSRHFRPSASYWQGTSRLT